MTYLTHHAVDPLTRMTYVGSQTFYSTQLPFINYSSIARVSHRLDQGSQSPKSMSQSNAEKLARRILLNYKTFPLI